MIFAQFVGGLFEEELFYEQQIATESAEKAA
jgi:hypothetical protein